MDVYVSGDKGCDGRVMGAQAKIKIIGMTELGVRRLLGDRVEEATIWSSLYGLRKKKRSGVSDLVNEDRGRDPELYAASRTEFLHIGAFWHNY